MGKMTLQQVRKQIADLREREQQLMQAEVGGVISRIKEAIAYYSITPEQLFGDARADAGESSRRGRRGRKAGEEFATAKRASPRKSSKKGYKVPVKFRDEQGNTWTGRGNQPLWLRAAIESGRKLEDFSVSAG